MLLDLYSIHPSQSPWVYTSITWRIHLLHTIDASTVYFYSTLTSLLLLPLD